MGSLLFRSQTIGSVALEALQAASQGQTIGQTSGGVFLHTEAGWVLFLSLAGWRGPLTINLFPVDRENLQIDLHSPFFIQNSAIIFPEERIQIEFNEAECWSPPPRPLEVLPLVERAQRFAQVSTVVAAGLADRFETGQESISNLDAFFYPGTFGLSAVHTALASRQPDKIVAALTAGLGRGPGLTPAGDDLALGFLLALNRWGDRLCPNLPPESINQGLIDAARQHTTALSASLIKCAAAGSADERLVSALDGLVSGNLIEDSIVDHFRGWGHTSGAAALQGMGLTIAF